MTDDTKDKAILAKVRGRLIERGDTLAAWCRRESVDFAHAHRVLCWQTNGPRARDLRARLLKEVGLEA